MYTAAKLVAASAILAVTGAFLFSSVEQAPPEVGAPPAGEVPTEFSRVTGIATCVDIDPGTYEDVIGGVMRFREVERRCEWEMTDPRLSGSYVGQGGMDCFPVVVKVGVQEDECLGGGTSALEGDDAGWECSATGTTDPYAPFNVLYMGTCTGTGANDGWTYVYQQTIGDYSEFRDGSNIHGVLYQGDPPPFE